MPAGTDMNSCCERAGFWASAMKGSICVAALSALACSGSTADPTDTPPTDTPPTDTPQTDTPQTDTPQTDTPQTDTPASWMGYLYSATGDTDFTLGEIALFGTHGSGLFEVSYMLSPVDCEVASSNPQLLNIGARFAQTQGVKISEQLAQYGARYLDFRLTNPPPGSGEVGPWIAHGRSCSPGIAYSAPFPPMVGDVGEFVESSGGKEVVIVHVRQEGALSQDIGDEAFAAIKEHLGDHLFAYTPGARLADLKYSETQSAQKPVLLIADTQPSDPELAAFFEGRIWPNGAQVECWPNAGVLEDIEEAVSTGLGDAVDAARFPSCISRAVAEESGAVYRSSYLYTASVGQQLSLEEFTRTELAPAAQGFFSGLQEQQLPINIVDVDWVEFYGPELLDTFSAANRALLDGR